MEVMEGDDRSPSQQQQQSQDISNTTPSSTASTAAISVSRVNVIPNNLNNGSLNNGNLNYPVVELETLRHDELGQGDGIHNTGEEGEGGKFQRKWRFFPGKNRFYCDGRVMTAPSIRFCVLSFALILLTFTLFIIFDAPFLTERLSVAVPILGSILFISVIVNMIKTSFSDPGILPRASQQEADHLEKSYYSTNFRPPPRTKDIIVNGQVIKSKYCFTCKMFRPPRASHCGVCDNCVDRFDHHCPFLGNCIGKRNYRSFYAFIVSLSFLAVFVLSASIAHLAMLSKESGNFVEALRDSPSSAIVIVISFFGMWTVIGLTGFHTYLIAVEQTTNEDIKGLFGRANAKNPFSHGNFCQNCCFVLCGPSQPSLIDPRGVATSDFIASLPRKTDPNGKVPQHTPAKPSSNNCASDQLGQQGTFVGGTNKIYREQNSAAQSVQPVQHQPLQFSSPPSHASSVTEVSNGGVVNSSQPFPGLPAIPPEEKILLKGQTRNGVRGVVDYRQTVPESTPEEIHMSQQEALISPSAASTVSLSTLSTSNMSSSNEYDTINSPSAVGTAVAGVTNISSVRLQQPRNRNPNMTRRLFAGTSASSEQLEGVVDPSDFDDDLDMPSLSNINENEVIRRTNPNMRDISNSNGNKINGNGLTKSTRSLPSTSIAAGGVTGDSSDINKIHVLETSYPSSSKSSVNSSNKIGVPTSSAVGARNSKFANGGTRNINNKRNLEPTMQNSPLHLDTIM